MSSSTYGGEVFRVLPVVPLPVGSGSIIKRGMVLQWDPVFQQAQPWLSGATPALGVAVRDPDPDVLTVDTYLGKGASVLILCDTNVVPGINDFLFWSAPGAVSNTGVAGQQFARAIAAGFDGYVEAIIV
jgi:hypothetical protein